VNAVKENKNAQVDLGGDMHKRCSKCGTKKNITRHHIFGKLGYNSLKYDSKLPLLILLAWLRWNHDEVTILFWNSKLINLCRGCHDEFHLLFSQLIKECDITQSEEPIITYLEKIYVKRMGSRYEYTYR